MIEPRKRYGILRPRRVQVLSLYFPTSGWTISPMSGGRIQKKLRLCGSAPRVAKMRLIFAFCSEYAIWTPKNPKLMFHICQKVSFVFCIIKLFWLS